MLPTFIVIGAMKSGTTSLYHYLDEHPEVGMSAQKETDFFVAEKNYERGRAWYESLFDASAKARGEVSPNYTKGHLFSGVAARMNALVPGAKLIYLVRDPIDRLVSHYTGSRAVGREGRALPDALADLDGCNYVQTSRYHRQLEPYLAHYDPDDLLVVPSRDLREAQGRTLRAIYRFIGVDETFENTRTKRLNASSSLKQRGRWYRLLSGAMSQPLKDALRPYVPLGWLPGSSSDAPRPTLSASQEARLTDYLADDVRALRALTNRRFPNWRL